MKILTTFVILFCLLFCSNYLASAQTSRFPACVWEPGGANNGRTLILIRGLWTKADTVDESREFWSTMIPSITNSYSHIIFFSYDRNSSESYSRKSTYGNIWNHHVPLLHDLIESCRSEGFESFDIIGHSLGGVVASEYIKQYGLNGGQAGVVKNVITLSSPVNGTKPIEVLRSIPHLLINAPRFMIDVATSSAMTNIVFLSFGDTVAINQQMAANLGEKGITLFSIANAQDLMIAPRDAVIPAHGTVLDLGIDPTSEDSFRRLGHHQSVKSLEVNDLILSVIAN